MKLDLTTSSGEETFQVGVQLARKLHPNSILAFYGDLGAGKTTLIKGLAHALGGVEESEISSPTFTYLNIYSTDSLELYHFDLYRLQNASQFVEMGFDEYLSAGGVCCIEWAERIKGHLPKERIDVHLSHTPGGRKILIESFYEEVCF